MAAPIEAGALEATLEDREARKTKLINRLRRLEGQVRGLQRMVEEERDCQEILTLMSGVRSALNATGDLVLETYLQECQPSLADGSADLEPVIKAVKLARG